MAAESVSEALTTQLRIDVLDMVYEVGSGHIDSSFSVIEILAVLYFDVLRIDPNRPQWPLRDRLVLSKGHAAPALYACLARRGFFDRDELRRLRQIGSHLQGHPKPPTPGIEAPTGSLGQGLSLATGMAYAGRLGCTVPRWRAFAVCSDGEMNEGQTWEAAMLAGHLGLSNLTMVIDLNGLQYSGPTHDVLKIHDLPAALEAMGWSCDSVEGHDIRQLREALATEGTRPRAVLASTVKGRGIPFLENSPAWHGKVPSQAEYLAGREGLMARLRTASSK